MYFGGPFTYLHIMKFILYLLLFFLIQNAGAQKLTSGGKLKPEQAIMDVRHYTIALDVDPSMKSIKGYTTIDIIMLQPTKVLLFDLLDSFRINNVTVNGTKQDYSYLHNMININMSKELPAGKASVTVWYEGKPHIAVRPPWDDGFTCGINQRA